MCYDRKDIRARKLRAGAGIRDDMASYVQATRLRKGNLIKVGNDLFRLLELHHLTPGNKRAHIQVRMRNIRTLALADHKFRAEEDVERASLDEREMQYMYSDGDDYYFMDTSTYEQIHISAEALGDSKDYLMPEALIKVEFYDVEPVGIELPPTVDLVVKETVPGIKGATASAQVKPATLETGLVISVPSFVNEGDKIRVNTETGEYQSRV
jgi:elongation factor P